MLYTALIVNIAVLVPVIHGILTGQNWAADAYGPDNAARRIVACFYGAILLASAALIPALALLPARAVPWVRTLLVVQILYKSMTVALLGLGNPVVVANW